MNNVSVVVATIPSGILMFNNPTHHDHQVQHIDGLSGRSGVGLGTHSSSVHDVGHALYISSGVHVSGRIYVSGGIHDMDHALSKGIVEGATFTRCAICSGVEGRDCVRSLTGTNGHISVVARRGGIHGHMNVVGFGAYQHTWSHKRCKSFGCLLSLREFERVEQEGLPAVHACCEGLPYIRKGGLRIDFDALLNMVGTIGECDGMNIRWLMISILGLGGLFRFGSSTSSGGVANVSTCISVMGVPRVLMRAASFFMISVLKLRCLEKLGSRSQLLPANSFHTPKHSLSMSLTRSCRLKPCMVSIFIMSNVGTVVSYTYCGLPLSRAL